MLTSHDGRQNLIDLAGSERAATDVDRLKEGSYINKRFVRSCPPHTDFADPILLSSCSLLVLGNVIEKLTESKPAS